MNKLSQIGGVISTGEFQRRKGRASTRWLFYELGYFESIENLLFFLRKQPNFECYSSVIQVERHLWCFAGMRGHGTLGQAVAAWSGPAFFVCILFA